MSDNKYCSFSFERIHKQFACSENLIVPNSFSLIQILYNLYNLYILIYN